MHLFLVTKEPNIRGIESPNALEKYLGFTLLDFFRDFDKIFRESADLETQIKSLLKKF